MGRPRAGTSAHLIAGQAGCLVVPRCWAKKTASTSAYAHVARFPDLIEVVQGRTSNRLSEALADRLARLSHRCAVATPALVAAVPTTTALAAIVTTAGQRPAQRRTLKQRTHRSAVLAAFAGTLAAAHTKPEAVAWDPEE